MKKQPARKTAKTTKAKDGAAPKKQHITTEDRHRAFAREYVALAFNATQAAIAAGKKEGGEGRAPSIGIGVLCALLLALLMLVHALAEVLLPKDSGLLHAAAFLGNPLVAMLLGVVFASITLGYLRGADAEKLRDAGACALRAARHALLQWHNAMPCDR